MAQSDTMSWRGWLALIVAVAVIAALVAWGVLSRRAELADAPHFETAPLAVHTVIAEDGPMQRRRRYVAEAEAVRTAQVTARVTERITAVEIDEGDRVAAGAPLIQLDASVAEARLGSVAAELAQARAEREAEKAQREALARSADYQSTEVERLRQLYQQGDVSESEFDEALDRLATSEGELTASRKQVEALTAHLDSLRARQQELRRQRANYTLEAPFAGVVTERRVDSGDQAAPGKPLATVATTQRMRLVFGVPRADRPAVAPGQPVRFELAGEERQARITRIHPALDASRLARAEVDLAPELRLPPGAAVAVTVTLPAVENVAVIPAGALAGGDEQPTLYIVEAGKARARTVRVRARSHDRVAVSGIEPGAKVVTKPYLGWTRLADGMPVKEISP